MTDTKLIVLHTMARPSKPSRVVRQVVHLTNGATQILVQSLTHILIPHILLSWIVCPEEGTIR